jgi:hypothetical protein
VPYFIYVRDAKTGEPAKRMFSDAASEDAARAEAESAGMQVASIVACRADQRPDATPATPNLALAAAGNGAIAVSGGQRDAIDDVARYMKIVGIVMIVLALLSLALGVYAKSVAFGVQGLMVLGLGVLTVSTAGKFRSVNENRGNPGLLTEALESLRSLYFVQVVIYAIGFALLVVLLLGLMLFIKFR